MFLMINGFILILCSLIAISSYFLKQSGKVNLVINNGEPAAGERGQTLFAALAERDVFLPAACGGKGTCARCLVTCRQGGGPLTPMERLSLSENDIRQGLRLACQIKLREDLSVELPKELLAAKKYLVKLDSARFAGEGIRLLELKILNNQLLEFKPGQYVQIYRQLPHEKVVRAYSLSSDSRHLDRLSLDVQYVAGGIMSPWLHQLEPGAELEISGPYGEMFFEPGSDPVVLVAGGVGLAPMRSILASLVQAKNPPPTWLFWGARHRVHLYAEKELQELLQKHRQWFHFFPALSGALLEEGWQGPRGMIHEILTAELPDLPNAKAFICGPGPMMSAVEEVLLRKGLELKNIKADPFDF